MAAAATWKGGGVGRGVGGPRDLGAPGGRRRAAVAGPRRGGEGRAAAARVGGPGPADEERRVGCGAGAGALVTPE